MNKPRLWEPVYCFWAPETWQTEFKTIPEDGPSLGIQWLRLHAFTAGGAGFIPGEGIKILHACCTAKKPNKIKILFYNSRAVPWWPSVRILGFHCCYLGSIPGGGNRSCKLCVWQKKKKAIPDLPAKAHTHISTGLGDEETLPSETQERGGKPTHVTQPVSDQGEKRGQYPASLPRAHSLGQAGQLLCSPSEDRGGWEGLQPVHPAPDPKSDRKGSGVADIIESVS